MLLVSWYEASLDVSNWSKQYLSAVILLHIPAAFERGRFYDLFVNSNKI